MLRITDFGPQLQAARPDTAELLRSAQLTVHPAVSLITLHGSRGLAGGHRPDSDVDLCLVVDAVRLARAPDPAAFLDQVLRTTLDAWVAPVEADLAAVWDEQGCGLQCLEHTSFDTEGCPDAERDCFGLYKIQRGFNGFVRGAGVEVRRMVPCLVIWRNPTWSGVTASRQP